MSIINNQKQHLLSKYKYNVKVPLAKSSSSCRVLDVDFADDDRGGELDKLELESLTKKENLGIKQGCSIIYLYTEDKKSNQVAQFRFYSDNVVGHSFNI